MTDIIALVYDSTVAMIYGILNATVQADGSYKIPDYVSGLLCYGRVSFSKSGRGGSYNFGIGDRIEGVRFQVVNFQAENSNNMSTFHLHRVGTWTPETGKLTLILLQLRAY
jgi:hypothetical protein